MKETYKMFYWECGFCGRTAKTYSDSPPVCPCCMEKMYRIKPRDIDIIMKGGNK